MVYSRFFPIINLFLRGLTLLSKFLFIYVIAKFYSVDDVAEYTLFTSIIVYSVYIVGLDFYTYSNRNMIVNEKHNISNEIFNQILLYFFVFFVFVVLFYLFKFNEIIGISHPILFLIILFSEHLSQEFTRILIVLEKQVAASFCLFLRTSTWCVVSTILIYWGGISLYNIFIIWAVFSYVSMFFGVFYVHRKVNFKFSLFSLNLKWIKKGILISLPFIIASLAYRFSFVFDRYFLEDYFNSTIVASYAVYAAICSSLVYVFDALVLQFSYPKLIKEYSSKNFDIFKILVNQLIIKSVLIISLLFLFVLIISGYLLSYLGEPAYIDNFKCFIVILFGYLFYSLSYVPHYILYSMSDDRWILISSLVIPLIFVSGVLIVSNVIEFSFFYFSCVLLISFIMSFLVKSVRTFIMLRNIVGEM